tara:strand:+ start:1608 stop:1733 length:126 start_codon:yes stop_codon:yes gene_type:complete
MTPCPNTFVTITALIAIFIDTIHAADVSSVPWSTELAILIY